MHDRQATVIGFVALPGGVLVVIAGVVHWLVDPSRGSVWFIAIGAIGGFGLAAILVGAGVAAQAEYRISRVEGATRQRNVRRAVRVVFGLLFHLVESRSHGKFIPKR